MIKLTQLLGITLVALLMAGCQQKTEKATTTTTTAPTELSSADVRAITNREISTWEFAKTKQMDKLNEVLAEDYQAFFGQILMNKAEVMQSFQKSIINVYRLLNIRVKKVSDNVAIIYYEALQDATDPEGDRWVPKIAASNVYVKRGNNWYAVFYHETPMIQ
jgi:hypothetical protein